MNLPSWTLYLFSIYRILPSVAAYDLFVYNYLCPAILPLPLSLSLIYCTWTVFLVASLALFLHDVLPQDEIHLSNYPLCLFV